MEKKIDMGKEDFLQAFEAKVVTAPVAAQMLGITPPALHKMLKSGRIQVLKKLGRETLYWREDIEKKAEELKEKYKITK